MLSSLQAGKQPRENEHRETTAKARHQESRQGQGEEEGKLHFAEWIAPNKFKGNIITILLPYFMKPLWKLSPEEAIRLRTWILQLYFPGPPPALSMSWRASLCRYRDAQLAPCPSVLKEQIMDGVMVGQTIQKIKQILIFLLLPYPGSWIREDIEAFWKWWLLTAAKPAVLGVQCVQVPHDFSSSCPAYPSKKCLLGSAST